MRSLASCAEKRELRPGGNGILRAYNHPLAALEGHLPANGFFGRDGNEFIHREIPFLQHLEHSCAHQTRGTYESDFHI